MSSQLTLNLSDSYSVNRHQSVSAFSVITEPSLSCLTWNKKDTHVIWSSEFQAEFEQWWDEKTDWDQDTDSKVTQHKSVSWKSRAHKAELWALFYEAANVLTEKSAVICRLCEKVLKHSTSIDAEINDMIKHISNRACNVN